MFPLQTVQPSPAPAPPPAANPTIGLVPGSPLLVWANLHGVQDELHFFAKCLRVQGAIQSGFFGGALDGLSNYAQTLRRWEAAGEDTFGLEVLGDQWRLTKHTLGQLPERATTRTPLRDFAGTAESQYLHLAVHSRLLDGPQAAAQLALRSWALIRAHRFLADGKWGGEPYLRELCANLRLATYERLPDWGPVLSALVVKDQSFDMIAADLQATPSDIQGRMPSGSTLQPKHLAFLSSMSRLAGGNWEEPKAASLERLSPPSRRKTPAVAAAAAAEPSPEAIWYPGGETGGDVDTQKASVDPRSPPRRQEHEARSIYLTTAVEASLARWRWSTPSPHEASTLRNKVRLALTDDSATPEHKLLAVLVWLALHTGRTLDEVCRISIDAVATKFSQWTLDLSSGTVSRKAPRRAQHWQPRGDVIHLIHEPAEQIDWHLPPDVLATLRKAAFVAVRPHYLRDAWTAASSLAPDHAFLTWMQQDRFTARLHPGMLANALKQDIFERTGDGLLARLLGSRERDGLPAAAAYGTYLSTSLPEAFAHPPETPRTTNVAGSLLAPTSETALRAGFRRAHAGLERLQSAGTWIEFHNMLVLYWDAVLRAATGIRPTNTLWTDRDAIDWKHAFVFVDEKASPLQRSGRLVPIPFQVLEAFRTMFLEQQLPYALDAIRQHGFTHDPTKAGNLLFLIDEGGDGPPVCMPVTGKDRERLGIEQPFPLNVFRHRLRTGLQRLKADPEVIDSAMGHSDGSSPTHGPYSMRTWSHDADVLRPALRAVWEALDIRLPPKPNVVHFRMGANATPRMRQRVPGPPSRLRTARLAIAESLVTISNFLIETLPPENVGDAALDQSQVLEGLVRLTDVQVEQLENLLTLTDKGMPSTTGALKHAYLVKLAKKAWDVLEKPVRLRSRYRASELEPSAYTSEAPGALDRRLHMQSILDDLFEARPHASHVTLAEASVLLTMDLIANSRIASARVLAAPLDSRVNCRLAKLGETHYLEWSPDASLAERPDAPIQRFAITERAARLLEDLLTRSRSVDVDGHASSALRAVRAALDVADDATFEVVREKASACVAQCNVIELPGAVAAYLNGSLMTAALGPADFVRYRRQIFVRPPQPVGPLDLGDQTPLALGAMKPTAKGTEVDEAEKAARLLFRNVNSRLKELQAPELSRHRQQGLLALSRSVSDTREVSTTVRLLCLWSIDRLQNEDLERRLGAESAPKPPDGIAGKKTRRKTIQTVSAIKYLSTLKSAFVDLASDVDILSLESEELADFYQAVLSESQVQNLNYLHRRLRDFHRFCMRHGASAVDWSELVPANAPDLGAPGFIDEAAYRKILEAVGTVEPPKGIQNWQLLVFVIFCYRFGLRGGEVGHLRQDDFNKLPDGLRVVLVRPRRFHRLKSTAARRQVPLVFPLTDLEEDALGQLARHHDIAALGASRPPLLGAADDPQREIADAVLRQHLNQIIQAVTGQPSLSLHDMRHSFACRVWQALESPTMPVGTSHSDLSASDLTHLRNVLLGPQPGAQTRRSAHVLAACLGHKSLATGMRAYIHFVAEAAEMAVSESIQRVPRWSANRRTSNDLLDVLERVPAGGGEVALVTRDRALTPVLALDALVYFSQGRSAADAAALLGVSTESTERLSALTLALDSRLGSRPKRTLKKARVASGGLLSRLPTSSFQRLRVGLASPGLVEQPSVMQAGLADAHILGMVGPDRQVSMWTRAQMSLVARLIRVAEIGYRRLALMGPPQAPPSLLRAAVATGWLPAIQAAFTASGGNTLCAQVALKQLPAPAVVAPLDTRIANRLVLELTSANNGWIHDRVEFWISLICVRSCTPSGPGHLLLDPDNE